MKCTLIFRSAVLLCLTNIMLVGGIRADLLHLTNGESLSGTLVQLDAGRLQWNSEILGELDIDQSHVRAIETGTRFDLKLSRKELRNCWMYRENSKQLLHCDEGVEALRDWKLVVAVAPELGPVGPRLQQKGEVRLAVEDSNGNTNLERYDLESDVELRYADHRHNFRLRYLEEDANGSTTQNSWRGGYRYDRFLTPQWFLSGNAFYEEDEFKDLDQRASVGAGGGFQFIDTEYVELIATSTINFVEEEFGNTENRQTTALLWSLQFNWKFNDDGMEFFHRHSALQAFDETADYELDSSTGLKYPINGHFSSVVQYEYSFDNIPADDARRIDRTWSVGMNYNW